VGSTVQPTETFEAGTAYRLIVTRSDSAPDANQFTAYLNGALTGLSFADAGGASIFTGGIMQFFKDDSSVAEAAPGIVDRIAIYDSPLTAGEVEALNGPAAVPEPGSLALSVAAGAAIALAVLRRRWQSSVSQGVVH
jgi:hypothetical protein